jgi:hypothetical protein
MDSSFNSVDRIAPYTGSGKVAPAHHSEKDKERRKSDTLEQSFEDELEQEQKEHRHDKVELHDQKQEDEQDDSSDTPESNAQEDEPKVEQEPAQVVPPTIHVDVKA